MWKTISNIALFQLTSYACFTIIAWILNFSILLPLQIVLRCSASLREKCFVYVYTILGINPDMVHGTKEMRKDLFNLLTINKTKPKLLEIGAAQGLNFKYYPENSDVTLLDENKHFDMELTKSLKNFPDLNIEKKVIASVEDMSDLQNSEYDIVVCTYVFCTVKDCESAFAEISRVLKKGGQFIYLDHVAYPKYTLIHWIQVILTPMWTLYTNGCRLNINHNNIVKAIDNYFNQNSYKIIYPSFMLYVTRATVMGVATK